MSSDSPKKQISSHGPICWSGDSHSLRPLFPGLPLFSALSLPWGPPPLAYGPDQSCCLDSGIMMRSHKQCARWLKDLAFLCSPATLSSSLILQESTYYLMLAGAIRSKCKDVSNACYWDIWVSVRGALAENANHSDHRCVNLLSILLCLGKLLLSSGMMAF